MQALWQIGTRRPGMRCSSSCSTRELAAHAFGTHVVARSRQELCRGKRVEAGTVSIAEPYSGASGFNIVKSPFCLGFGARVVIVRWRAGQAVDVVARVEVGWRRVGREVLFPRRHHRLITVPNPEFVGLATDRQCRRRCSGVGEPREELRVADQHRLQRERENPLRSPSRCTGRRRGC